MEPPIFFVGNSRFRSEVRWRSARGVMDIATVQDLWGHCDPQSLIVLHVFVDYAYFWARLKGAPVVAIGKYDD